MFSGKSSLILTLFRLLNITSGTILIDNLDISNLPREIVRTRITTIPQDPVFLPGTVRFNLSPTVTTTDSLILAVLTRVGLCSIIEIHGGLQADVADLPLSHGQKQLLCLARAMLSHSSVLVIDEASSSVDVETDKLIQDILRTEFKSQTVLAVAHRVQTIADFDRVVVLERGRVVEFGDPRDLLARDRGAFRGLYEQQQ